MAIKNKKIKYSYNEVLPIETKLSSVWKVKFFTGETYIYCLSSDSKIEEVVSMIKTHCNQKKRFTVQSVFCGQYLISDIDNDVCNARKLNQDLIIEV